MIRIADIQEKLLHLIGWEQTGYDAPDLKISDSLTISESGLYFQQIHPLLTLQNMACIAPDFKNTEDTYPVFSLASYYNPGDVVRFDGKLYRCKKRVTGVDPYGNFQPVNLMLTNHLNPSFEDDLKNITIDKKYLGKNINYVDDSYSGKKALQYSYTDGVYISAIFGALVLNKGTYEMSFMLKRKPLNNGEPFSSGSRIVFQYFYTSSALKIAETHTDDFASTNEWIHISNKVTFDNNVVSRILRLDTLISDKSSVYVVDDISVRDITYEDASVNVEEYWEEFMPFSKWLEDKTKASIQKVIARFCNEKIAQGTYKTLCENRTLFDGTGRLVDVVKNKKNLVGFEIIPVRAKGVTTKINKIGLQFTEPGEYTIYIMHSSMSAPFKTIKLEKKKKNSTEWFTLDNVYLPYQSQDTDAGGSWYLCYFQSELPNGSQAIRKDKDWSKGPCGSCSRNELIAWQAWSKYLEIHPFFVNEELVNSVRFSDDFSDDFNKQPVYLWDVKNNQYTYDNNYGINLEVTVGCDITDFIVEQRTLFQDIIAKQVAVDMLREFAYNANVRTNRHSINASRLDILYEVDGDSSSMKQSGLSYQLDMAFKAIKMSTSGIDRVCLPCKNNGIKYKTV